MIHDHDADEFVGPPQKGVKKKNLEHSGGMEIVTDADEYVKLVCVAFVRNTLATQ